MIPRKQVHWIWSNHTYINCQHYCEEEDKEEEGKIKESKQSSRIYEGRWEQEGGTGRRKITLGDRPFVFELITPTQAFSNQQEEALNGWSEGGEMIEWKEEKEGQGRKIVESVFCV